MKDPKKRYLVTFQDDIQDAKSASEILQVKSTSMKSGIGLMASDSMLTDADVLHFEGTPISSISLSKEEAEALNEDPRVVAVEEDIEVFPLGRIANPSENGNGVMSEEMEDIQQAYEKGYQQAVDDLHDMPIADDELNSVMYTPAPDQPYNPWPRFPWGRRPFPFPFPYPWPGPWPGPGPIDRFKNRLSQPMQARTEQEEYTAAFPPLLQPTPWNISMVKAPAAWARGIRGDGVKVAVLDTGIAAHPDLVISGGVSFVPGVTSYNDGHGHGTHCAGVIGARNNTRGVVGVAPKCKLFAVKVLSDGGSGSLSSVIAGMIWARDNGMNVVSMSLGSESIPLVAYNNAVQKLHDAGVVVVCAAGNSFNPPTDFPWVNAPANSATNIAVAAVDKTKTIAYFSSRGSKPGVSPWNQVTLAAPGVAIKSTIPGGYTSMSGTSMATPHVAGAAALIIQRHHGIRPAAVKTLLMKSSSDLGAPGRDKTYGSGLLNCDRATR